MRYIGDTTTRRPGGGFDLGEGRVGDGDSAMLSVRVGHVMHDGDVDVELPNGCSATVKWCFVHPLPHLASAQPQPSKSDEELSDEPTILLTRQQFADLMGRRAAALDECLEIAERIRIKRRSEAAHEIADAIAALKRGPGAEESG